MHNPPTVLGDVIERNARYFPGKTAVVFEGRRITYAEFTARVRRFANVLASYGMQRQARFAVLAQNCVEYFEAVGAAELTGFIAVTLNWRLSTPELAQIIADSTPTVLIFEAQFGPQVDALRRQGTSVERFIVIGTATHGAESYEELLAGASDAPPPLRPEPDDGVYLIYTSGTTGRPKGVLLSHRAILSAAISISWEQGVRPSERMLIVMPLFHIGAKINQLANIVLGTTIVLHRAFDPAAVLRSIEDEAITCAHLAPVMVRSLLDSPELTRFRRDSLQSIQYASAPMSVALLREAMAAFGPIFTQVYGMTECVVGTILHAHEHRPDGTPAEARRLASAGQPFFDHAIRVVRPDGCDCAAEEVGDILIRGPSLMSGYWNNSAATVESLRDGWMHTGDVGFFDSEAFLFIVDRKKDMIVSGGENIYSREVEEALLTHPAVLQAAVIGVPDARWGESVKACIVLRPACSASADELIGHCRSLIASYKKPRSVDFLDALPRLFNGKIDKKELRAHYWQGQTRQVS
ncbi:MAG: long-chain-fatty-acid--CoA ligase [Xanthobacteraceae bacterium]